MTMKTFTAGWSLQKPEQNYFKKFLHINNISIDGIIYPKKIPKDIEGIPVLDFDDARDRVTPNDLVLDVGDNPELKAELDTFFTAKGIDRVGIPAYLDRLISEDQHDALQLPVAGMQSSDIRHLKSTPRHGRFDEHFLDAASYDVASRLDGIFRDSQWQKLVQFDLDDTPDLVLLDILLDLNKQGLVKQLRVHDTPRAFLDAILKLKLHDAKASFSVSVSEQAFAELGGRAEFYRRSLADCIVPFTGGGASTDPTSIMLTGSIDAIVAASAQGPLPSAICFMPRSIIDYVAVKNAFGERQYRILLRQPDTMAQHLIAAILTPALFGL